MKCEMNTKPIALQQLYEIVPRLILNHICGRSLGSTVETESAKHMINESVYDATKTHLNFPLSFQRAVNRLMPINVAILFSTTPLNFMEHYLNQGLINPVILSVATQGTIGICFFVFFTHCLSKNFIHKISYDSLVSDMICELFPIVFVMN
jgi:hypothetical protein